LKKDEKLNEFYVQSLLLSETIKRILKKKARIILSKKPTFKLIPIVEYMGRMRVSSLEKFNGPTYISCINFYINQKEMEKRNELGTLIIYIGENYIVNLFKKLGYPGIDEENYEVLEDACGTFCNIIAGKFREGLTQLGYVELGMSHFSSYRNEIFEGVAFDLNEEQKYEMSFEIFGKKCIMADLTMGSILKARK